METRFRQKRMVGGYPTTIESHPWQVAIELDNDYYCSGSIISPHLVLTAAHCVNFDLNSIKVRAGTALKLTNGTIHHPIEAIPHPNFIINEYLNSENDIALLRVNETFVYDNTHEPADLNNQVQSDEFGIWRWASFTSWSENKIPLQILFLPIVSKTRCNDIYKKFNGIKKGQLCAGYQGVRNKDSCIADSGAPLIFENKVSGVLAYSEGECGYYDYPTVFTEVAYYYDWIMGYVKSDK